jgi:hypothetical protein
MTAIVLPAISISSYHAPLRVDLRCECVDRGDRLQVAVADAHREEPPAPQDHEVLAVQLDDSAFVDACVLHVRHRIRGRSSGD